MLALQKMGGYVFLLCIFKIIKEDRNSNRKGLCCYFKNGYVLYVVKAKAQSQDN